MDPRWQPHLEHPPAPSQPTREAQELLAAGWHISLDECRLDHEQSSNQAVVSPQTWCSLRELASLQQPRVVMQQR